MDTRCGTVWGCRVQDLELCTYAEGGGGEAVGVGGKMVPFVITNDRGDTTRALHARATWDPTHSPWWASHWHRGVSTTGAAPAVGSPEEARSGSVTGARGLRDAMPMAGQSTGRGEAGS